MAKSVKTGLDLVEREWPKDLLESRVGLLVHPASVNSRLEHASDVFAGSKKFELKSFFGPQHGIRGETQDNMVEGEGFADSRTGLPVYSLYGKTREPEPSMLADIDVLAADMQDVGARYYTFIWTLALVMKACAAAGKKVVVLDRPNPIGGDKTEGPVLRPEFRSFVGLHPIPVRHGMTIGEISLYLRDNYYPSLELYVIRLKGWKREMMFEDTGLPWVLPSPNMPTVDTAIVYPGMCLLEATNLSEGRGTTRPFEIFGAPFIDPDTLVNRLAKFDLKGVAFRPLYFLPTFQKHAGQVCGGAQIHVTERKRFRPFRMAVAILQLIVEAYPHHFSWKEPPYEYEKVLPPIDILAGTDKLRIELEKGTKLQDLEEWWNAELRDFDRTSRRNHLLYP